jgi:3-oxoadipyl-CoA thiolase
MNNPINSAYLIDGIRTPIGNFGGSLSTVRTDDLAAMVLAKLRERNQSIDFSQVSDVILGCANQAGEDNRNVARMALLLAGYPFSIPGETVNRLCASGLSASIAAAKSIMCGFGDLVIAGGVENMTRGPWTIGKASTPFGRDQQMYDTSFGWRFINSKMKDLYGVDAMGETAENLAELYQIKREDQDEFAFNSHQKTSKAKQNGFFEDEIMQVEIPLKNGEPKIFNHDEFHKPQTSLEVLAKLKPAFRRDGSVTAGNSSGLNDGSVALLFAGETAIRQYSLNPLARIVSVGAAGVEPRIMGIGPVEASNLALKRAGLTYQDMDVIELNEAFSAQVLSCLNAMGIEKNDPRVNPNGGAIALGHPLGMSGGRILLTAARQLRAINGKFALVTMCIGVGQGYAVIIERP